MDTLMGTLFLTYISGGIFYGFVLFMATISETGMRKWLYTIPIWPLTLIVLLLRICWFGLQVTFEWLDD